MKTPVLVTLAATIIAFGGLITFLVVTDRDPALLVTSVAIIIPTLGALFLTQKTVSQTNGTLSALRVENGLLREENATLRTYAPTEAGLAVPTTPAVLLDPNQ
jgi:hypothetical protein